MERCSDANFTRNLENCVDHTNKMILDWDTFMNNIIYEVELLLNFN